MACFSRKEIAAAARVREQSAARLTEIEEELASHPERHQDLNREAARVQRDYQAAGFVLTEDGGA
jgi:hypothetical protein